jgi:hypothetical protein
MDAPQNALKIAEMRRKTITNRLQVFCLGKVFGLMIALAESQRRFPGGHVGIVAVIAVIGGRVL